MKEILIHYYKCDYCDETFKEKWQCESHEIEKHMCSVCKNNYQKTNSELGCKLIDDNKSSLCKFEKKGNF